MSECRCKRKLRKIRFLVVFESGFRQLFISKSKLLSVLKTPKRIISCFCGLGDAEESIFKIFCVNLSTIYMTYQFANDNVGN